MTLVEKIEPIQGACGNSTLQCLSTGKSLASMPIPRFNDEQLIVEERYSTIDGCFGTVRTQECRDIISLGHRRSFVATSTFVIRTTYSNRFWSKRWLRMTSLNSESLRPNTSCSTHATLSRERFDEEHLVWTRLSHPNLVQFFGYTVQQNYALFEHSNLGDLYTYLLSTHCLQHDQAPLSFVVCTFECRIWLFFVLFHRMNVRLLIITQLANALRYLESEKIVHRDIAARNCLIYPNYEIKLTNSALATHEFQSHYLTIDCQRRLPIRWMAPETLTHVNDPSMKEKHQIPIVLCFFLERVLLPVGHLVIRDHTVGSDDQLFHLTVCLVERRTSVSTAEIDGNKSSSLLGCFTTIETRILEQRVGRSDARMLASVRRTSDISWNIHLLQ